MPPDHCGWGCAKYTQHVHSECWAFPSKILILDETLDYEITLKVRRKANWDTNITLLLLGRSCSSHANFDVMVAMSQKCIGIGEELRYQAFAIKGNVPIQCLECTYVYSVLVRKSAISTTLEPAVRIICKCCCSHRIQWQSMLFPPVIWVIQWSLMHSAPCKIGVKEIFISVKLASEK